MNQIGVPPPPTLGQARTAQGSPAATPNETPPRTNDGPASTARPGCCGRRPAQSTLSPWTAVACFVLPPRRCTPHRAAASDAEPHGGPGPPRTLAGQLITTSLI